MTTLPDHVELRCINLTQTHLTSSELDALVDCILANPDVVVHIFLGDNEPTDQIAIKLARLLSISSTIKSLLGSYEKVSLETFQATAAAMRVNTSIQLLSLMQPLFMFNNPINLAFIDALRFNPVRPDRSTWMFSFNPLDCMDKIAERANPPSMLEFLLCAHSTLTNQFNGSCARRKTISVF